MSYVICLSFQDNKSNQIY